MWGKKTVAVLVLNSGYDPVERVLRDFDSTGYVDEVIIAGGRSIIDSEEETNTRTKVFNIVKLDYAKALKTAVDKSRADLIIVTDAEGSYQGKDVLKLLSYSDDFDVVFGSRTHLPLISKGSGMTFLRRVVDDLFGKLASILFLSPPLTDVGCTLRLTDRKSWKKISKFCKSPNEIFFTEWLLYVLKTKIRFIEIPVRFTAPQKVKNRNTIYYLNRALLILFYTFKIRFF